MNAPRLLSLPLYALLLFFLQPAQAQLAGAKLPLWKIEGKSATVYLLGSVHFLKKEHYPLAAPIGAAFDKAKVVAFETDIGALEKPDLQMKLVTKSTLPAGQTLRDQLSPKLYEQLAAQLRESGLPAEAVQQLKPGIVALTITMLEMKKLGLDEKLGVDRHFHERATKAGKEIIELEAPEIQVDLFTGFSKAEGEALLTATLKEISTLKQKLGELLTSWQTGDMKSLANMLNEAMEEHPELYKRFMVERNQRWVPKIEQLVRGDKDAIVIVGAGHLAGKQSVVELLEKNGLKVSQQ